MFLFAFIYYSLNYQKQQPSYNGSSNQVTEP